jgi:glutathione S-transferase
LDTQSRASLAYTSGSPFARMARVAIREWGLPVDEIEVAFPPDFALNPLGQVHVLTVDGTAVFPTLMVLERLASMAGPSGASYDGARDRQVLLTILSAGDALVAAVYQRWAGLGPVGPDQIGYDPADRNLARVRSVLDWLGADARPAALGEGVTLPRVALACLLLWIEVRGGLGWPVPSGIDAIVRELDGRESFRLTRPPDVRLTR